MTPHGVSLVRKDQAPGSGPTPTLVGVDFLRRAVGLAERYAQPGQTVHHTIQTNGSPLNDKLCELFHDHDFLVGLRVDGSRELHGRCRVDKSGKPSFDQVMRSHELLVAHGDS